MASKKKSAKKAAKPKTTVKAAKRVAKKATTKRKCGSCGKRGHNSRSHDGGGILDPFR